MGYLAIIWFGFHMVWKIMQSVEGFIRRGRGLTIDLYFKNMLTSTHVNFPFSLAFLSENLKI